MAADEILNYFYYILAYLLIKLLFATNKAVVY